MGFYLAYERPTTVLTMSAADIYKILSSKLVPNSGICLNLGPSDNYSSSLGFFFGVSLGGSYLGFFYGVLGGSLSGALGFLEAWSFRA